MSHRYYYRSNHQYFMQTQVQVQATIDICLSLNTFLNLKNRKIGPIAVRIKALCDSVISTPYQIITSKSYKCQSKIDLESYLSLMYYLKNEEKVLIDQILCFKLHIPIKHLQFCKLTFYASLESLDQISMDSQATKQLELIQFKTNSLLFIDTYFTSIFPKYGVALQGTVHTHLLTCKSTNFIKSNRFQLYQVIDNLVLCYNKLRQKVQIQQEQLQQQLPKFINMSNYPEYNQIRFFCQNKIFQDLNFKEHRQVLNKFITYFIPQMNQKLQILWNFFIKNIKFYTLQHKKRFFQLLQISLQNQIQYQLQKNNQINKKLPATFFLLQNTSFLSNSYKQSFTNSKTQYKISKMLNLFGIQIPCPQIKVALRTELIFNQKDKFQFQEIHLIVLVHGLGANSEAFSLIQTFLKFAYPHLYILTSKANQNSTHFTISEMGKALAAQIQQYIFDHSLKQNFKISFIGHSLGGLIIRSSLPYLSAYKFNMISLITFATPHLGYFFHNSKVNKLGMWMLQKFFNNQTMKILLMNDFKLPYQSLEQFYRNSQLYQLTKKEGLRWFQNIVFCGSKQDYFVSPLSALNQSSHQIQKLNSTQSKIWQQMRLNIQKQLKQSNVYRLLINFGNQLKVQTTVQDQILGKKAHVLYLTSLSFITYFIFANKKLFSQ